jgi:DNA polymerase-4
MGEGQSGGEICKGIMTRNVLHLRIDALPVAVERLRDSSLKKHPVVICPRHSPRSLIFSASPEARREGVFEGLPLTKALQRCRKLVVLPPNATLYRKATESIVRLLERYSPLVEPGFWGRFYVDMTGTSRLFGKAQDTAFRIRSEVGLVVQLNGTLGIGSNKLVSGVAAKVVAFHGDLCAVPFGSEASFLAPLRVRMLPAVRSRVERELLAEFNIKMIQQLAMLSLPQLVAVFGKLGFVLHRQALGIDERPVRAPEAKPFVLEEITLDEDTNDDTILLGILYRMIERGCRRMRNKGISARTIWLHIRYSDDEDATRRLRLVSPTTTDTILYRLLEPFFIRTNERRQRVRYLSLTFTDLVAPSPQLSLFDMSRPYQKEESLVAALDAIRARYGEKIVSFGRVMER